MNKLTIDISVTITDADCARLRETIMQNVWYHTRCDEYDRLTCTGPEGRDGRLPANGYESYLINHHARAARRTMSAPLLEDYRTVEQNASEIVLLQEFIDLAAVMDERLQSELWRVPR